MFSHFFSNQRRDFSSLSEQEVLALAISSEEDDERIYLSYANGLHEQFPDSAKIFEKMAEEEKVHRRRLIDIYKKRFGDTIPLIRREHVKGFFERKPDWLIRPLGIDKVREAASKMEEQAARFYEQAAKHTTDAETRKLLIDLAHEEAVHKREAKSLEHKYAPQSVQEEEREKERKQTLLTWIQPGLAGLMDGSISTLAPVFAAAFATGSTHQTFLVGLSASLGAGISMGFTEAAHDDGKLSGRGSPLKRGIANGTMTTLGGLGHTLPYLIPSFYLATSLAIFVVFIELLAITYIQNKFMEISFWRAAIQVIIGGVLVFATGIIIGSS